MLSVKSKKSNALMSFFIDLFFFFCTVDLMKKGVMQFSISPKKKKTCNYPLNKSLGCVIWTAAKTLDAYDDSTSVVALLTLH